MRYIVLILLTGLALQGAGQNEDSTKYSLATGSDSIHKFYNYDSTKLGWEDEDEWIDHCLYWEGIESCNGKWEVYFDDGKTLSHISSRGNAEFDPYFRRDG